MLAERFNARYAVGTTKRPLIRQQIEENVWRILASIAETHIERSLRDALSDCSYRALKCPANMHCRYATGRNCFVGRGISGNETAAESRVLRGGNWNNTSNNLQSSNCPAAPRHDLRVAGLRPISIWAVQQQQPHEREQQQRVSSCRLLAAGAIP